MLPDFPLWVGLANLTIGTVWSFFFAFFCTLMIAKIVLGKGSDIPAAEHWAERARRIWPLRRAQAFAAFFCPVIGAFTVYAAYQNAAVLPMGILVTAAVVAAFAGAQLGSRRLKAELGRDRLKSRGRAAWAGFAVLSLVLYPVLYLAVIFSSTMPAEFSWTGLFWATAFAACMTAIVKGGGVKLALILRVAKPAPPELTAQLRELANRLGSKQLSVYEMRTPMLNAFAMPWAAAILFTSGLLGALSHDEVLAVGAHEIGHMTEKPATHRARLALIWLVFVVMVLLYLLKGFQVDPMTRLLVVAGVVYGKLFLARRFLRSQEARADQVANDHEIGEGHPGIYAAALEKIYRLNGIPAVLGGKGKTHPHLYDRLLASGVTPDFPRPSPPSFRKSSVAMGAASVFGFAGALALILALDLMPRPKFRDDRSAIFTHMAVRGATSNDLEILGYQDFQHERYERAARYYTLSAARARRRELTIRLDAAHAYAFAKQCEEAKREFALAKKLTPDPEDGEEIAGFVADVGRNVASCTSLAH